MRMDRLMEGVELVETRGNLAATEISSIVFDSRSVHPRALFCCLTGGTFDGHDFASEAVRAGAAAVLCERPLPLDAVQVRVGTGGVRPAMAIAAANFFDHPALSLRMVGVTGTDGKTTVTHLVKAVLEAHGWSTAVIGTLGGAMTTPESTVLQEALADERSRGREAVAMEVSSHALDQHRVDAIRFSVTAFTNLSRDHLDYHGSMEAYFAAKAGLFTPERAQVGVVNADDPWGRRLLEAGDSRLKPFSIAEAVDLRLGEGGSSFGWEGEPVELKLRGMFNVTNALAAASVARELGVPPRVVARGLSELVSVPGRLEPVEAGQDFPVLVDYAHTPGALRAVLEAARRTAGSSGRVIVVFGCGGGRDRSKRPLMGRVATDLADLAVLTSDNPRGEDPRAIIEEVQAGVDRHRALVVEPDRASAIQLAVEAAQSKDVVVIAGKGHETGQETAGRVIPFDDRRVAAHALAHRQTAKR